MHIDALLGRGTGLGRKAVDQTGQPIGFGDDDRTEFDEFRICNLAFQELGGTPQAAQGVLQLVRQPPEHGVKGGALPLGVPLGQRGDVPLQGQDLDQDGLPLLGREAEFEQPGGALDFPLHDAPAFLTHPLTGGRQMAATPRLDLLQ